jgi:hypothetical protein
MCVSTRVLGRSARLEHAVASCANLRCSTLLRAQRIHAHSNAFRAGPGPIRTRRVPRQLPFSESRETSQLEPTRSFASPLSPAVTAARDATHEAKRFAARCRNAWARRGAFKGSPRGRGGTRGLETIGPTTSQRHSDCERVSGCAQPPSSARGRERLSLWRVASCGSGVFPLPFRTQTSRELLCTNAESMQLVGLYSTSRRTQRFGPKVSPELVARRSSPDRSV